MLVVAVWAIVLALPGELRNRREWRHLARMEAHYLSLSATHDALQMECRASQGVHHYDAIQRQWAVQVLSLPSFGSWTDEAEWHERSSIDSRRSAVKIAGEMQAVKGRLIVPLIQAIRRSP